LIRDGSGEKRLLVRGVDEGFDEALEQARIEERGRRAKFGEKALNG
jgi:hypothetical protein